MIIGEISPWIAPVKHLHLPRTLTWSQHLPLLLFLASDPLSHHRPAAPIPTLPNRLHPSVPCTSRPLWGGENKQVDTSRPFPHTKRPVDQHWGIKCLPPKCQTLSLQALIELTFYLKLNLEKLLQVKSKQLFSSRASRNPSIWQMPLLLRWWWDRDRPNKYKYTNTDKKYKYTNATSAIRTKHTLGWHGVEIVRGQLPCTTKRIENNRNKAFKYLGYI